MAKRDTRALDFRSKHESRLTSGGIGYYVPPNVTTAEWKRTYKRWQKKLRDSGFDEIEQLSHDCTGHFSPFFTKTISNQSLSGSTTTVARIYKPETEEYYRRLALFFHHGPFHTLFGANRWLYFHIVKLRKDGATLKDVAGKFNSKGCPKPIRGLKARFTIFFVWYHLQVIEPAINKWFRETKAMR